MNFMKDVFPVNIFQRIFIKNDTSILNACGQIFFSQPTSKPLHHFYIEIWDKESFHFEDKIGATVTDFEGKFSISWTPKRSRNYDSGMNLKIYELDYKFRKNSKKSKIYHLIDTVEFQGKKDLSTYDFGKVYVPYWTYDLKRDLPRLKIPDFGEPPCAFANGRNSALLKPLLRIEDAKLKHQLSLKMRKNRIDLLSIQKDYPVNKTIEMDKNKLDASRSDAYLCDRLLNGMIASIFDADKDSENIKSVHFHWSSYDQNGPYMLPNVTVRCLFSNDSVELKNIEIKMPEQPLATYEPSSKDWMQAKKILRMSASVAAELDQHLVGCHLNVEQYAVAARRNIRLNPVRDLLLPHLKEVAMINHKADEILLGSNGFIAQATGLSSKGLEKRISDVMGTLDWRKWHPRLRQAKSHLYSVAATGYFDFLDDYVREYLESHKKNVALYWNEIHAFSRELVEHSAPLFICNYLRSVKDKIGDEAFFSRYDWSERAEFDGHMKVDGVEKAVSPLTQQEHMDDQSFENLIELCKYVLFHTTFLHSWVNQRQYDDVGELEYAALGYYREQGKLTLKPEDATKTLWMGYLLSYTRYGFITENEEHDLLPDLPKRLKKLAEHFKSLGLEVEKINSRINI